jgi:hypothetical protein
VGKNGKKGKNRKKRQERGKWEKKGKMGKKRGKNIANFLLGSLGERVGDPSEFCSSQSFDLKYLLKHFVNTR